MSARKPLEPDCTGGIFCPIQGHSTTTRSMGNSIIWSHIPLTAGQRKTLRERLEAERLAFLARKESK